MKLEGKNAVVTGGGRGVGKAISLEFAKEGANVVVNYAGNQKAADEVVKQIQDMGRKAVAVKGDVGQEEDAKRVIDACVENFGSIHILVNNAGISKSEPASQALGAALGRSGKRSDERPLALHQSSFKVLHGTEIRKNRKRYVTGGKLGYHRSDPLRVGKGRGHIFDQVCSAGACEV